MVRKKYEVFNFGPTRDIPYKGGSFNLQQHWGFTTYDKKLVKLLSAFKAVSITEIVEKKEGPYAGMNYFKLKKMARDMNLDMDNNIKKKELIKLMEGVRT